MHLGKFLENELKRQRISIAEAALLVGKSDTAVRKDLKKAGLHSGVIESFQKILKVNIYQLLADEMDGNIYRVPEVTTAKELKPKQEKEVSKEPADLSVIDVISLNITVPVDKKEQILKMLFG